MKLTFTDPRDNQDYRIVRIGNQLWFAENMRYDVDGCSFMYGNRFVSYQKNGYLYCQDALDEICPPGWRIPSMADYRQLYRTFVQEVQRTTLVEKLSGKLQDQNIHLQLAGFGSELNGAFCEEELSAYFWTSSKGKIGDNQCCVMDSAGMHCYNPEDSRDLFSVRLVYRDAFVADNPKDGV